MLSSNSNYSLGYGYFYIHRAYQRNLIKQYGSIFSHKSYHNSRNNFTNHKSEVTIRMSITFIFKWLKNRSKITITGISSKQARIRLQITWMFLFEVCLESPPYVCPLNSSTTMLYRKFSSRTILNITLREAVYKESDRGWSGWACWPAQSAWRGH